MEAQRLIDMDRKDLESELQTKTNRLNQTEAQKKRMEADSKRKLQEWDDYIFIYMKNSEF